MKNISIFDCHSEEYLSDRKSMFDIIKNNYIMIFKKGFDEIYDSAYSFGEEFGREAEFNSTIKIIIVNLLRKTTLSVEEVNNIVNLGKDEKIFEYVKKMMDIQNV